MEKQDTPLRQLPAAGEVFLDHVGYFVPDMEAAGGAMERLGFRLTPLTAQTNLDPHTGELRPQGTANRCAMLQAGYVEILTPVADTPLAAEMRAGLARHAGLHLIAFSVSDAEAEHRRLERRGFEPRPPVHLRRPVERLGTEAAFTVLRLPPGIMPEGRIQLLTHHTPQAVWTPELLEHPNGAAALTAALVCVADPLEAARRFGRFTGREPRTEGALWSLPLDRGRVDFATPELVASVLGRAPPGVPSIAALAIGTRSLASTRQQLGAIAEETHGASLRVAPEHAVNAMLLFHEEAVPPPWTQLC